MSIFGKSVSVKLAQDATTGVVSLASQSPLFVDACISEVVGLVDGGLSTSVGAAHTFMQVVKMGVGVKFADQARELPLSGDLLK